MLLLPTCSLAEITSTNNIHVGLCLLCLSQKFVYILKFFKNLYGFNILCSYIGQPVRMCKETVCINFHRHLQLLEHKIGYSELKLKFMKYWFCYGFLLNLHSMYFNTRIIFIVPARHVELTLTTALTDSQDYSHKVT